jgi:hypothetical protein
MRIVEAGVANVRPVTWMKSSPVRAAQMRRPVFWLGGGVVEGIRDKNGISVYTIGKQ